MNAKVKIREGRREDCQSLRELVQQLADYEQMPDGPTLSAEDLEKDGFDKELFHFFVAEVDDELVGYAIYYYTFSTWKGQSMFLDELYVIPKLRNQKIGSLLFDAVTKKAVEMKCARLDFVVLSWNPAKDFYIKRGVADITESEKWHQYRMDACALKKHVDSLIDKK